MIRSSASLALGPRENADPEFKNLEHKIIPLAVRTPSPETPLTGVETKTAMEKRPNVSTVTNGSMVSREIISRDVSACLRVVYEIAKLYGFRPEANRKDFQSEMGSTFTHWVQGSCASGGWMKFVKYKLSAFFSAHTEQKTLPKRPFGSFRDDPKHLVGGRVGRFIDLLIKFRPNQRMSFLTSILRSKNGMPRPDSQQIRLKEAEAVQKLTSLVPDQRPKSIISWADLDERRVHPKVSTVLGREQFENQLRRTVVELFAGQRYSIEDRIRPFFPSTSANYQNSRRHAGTVGVLLEHPTLLDGLRKNGGYLHAEINKTGETEERREAAPLEELRITPKSKQEFDKAFSQLYWRIMKQAQMELPVVVPLGLAEPLKVRVITKGPPLLYTALKPLQRFMHSILRKHPCFTFIGEPVGDGTKLWHRLGADLKDNEVFVSADYEDSTNTLKSWVSNVIADEICNQVGIDGLEKTLFIDSLTGHTFLPPPHANPKTESEIKFNQMIAHAVADPQDRLPDEIVDKLIHQQHGQLMGSITSFPILCIANATICRWAMECAKGQPMKLNNMPLTINGDDAAFKTTEEGYAFWQRIAEYSGMKESIGKTFVSRFFVNINSTNFIYNRDNARPVSTRRMTYNEKGEDVEEFIVRYNPFHLVRYVNMGLLLGLKRSGGFDSRQETPYASLGSRYRALMEMAPLKCKEKISKMFFDHNRETIDGARLPYKIPEWLGGLGLTYPGDKYRPSRLDLQIAAAILCNWGRRKPRPLVQTGVQWKTWQLAQQRIPSSYPSSSRTHSGVDAYSSLAAAYCVDLLLDARTELDQIRVEEDTQWEAIEHNRKLWRPSRYQTGRLPKPVDVAQLTFQQTYPSTTPDPTYTSPSSRAIAASRHAFAVASLD
jgi:hypothetical protein